MVPPTSFLRRRALGASALTLLAILVGTTAAAQPTGLPGRAAVRSVPGEIVVEFREEADELDRDLALARGRARVLEHPGRARGRPAGAGPWRLATDLPVAEAIAALEADPAVEFAEPNFIVRPVMVANDPRYANGATWASYGDDVPLPAGPPGTTNEFGTQAERAWDAGLLGSRDVVVAVVDTGMQVDHPDLAANAWVNPFDAPDGVDEDGNGYVDDVHGWDFLAGDASVYDGPEDGHGTHVGGSIGAVGGNAVGVAGIAWEVSLLSLKFIGPDGGDVYSGIRALDYLVDLRQRHGVNVVAANCSWGSPDYSRGLHEALIRAARAGILIVAAAGNDAVDADVTPFYPAAVDTRVGTATHPGTGFDGVLSVAAIDSSGRLASFSNRGATSVDLGAPGVGIMSTIPGSSYSAWSGTSMAAPQVAGAVALHASVVPGSTAAELRAAILDGARPTASLAGVTVTGGRLDVTAGLLEPVEVVRRGSLSGRTRFDIPLPDAFAPGDARSWLDPDFVVDDGRTLFYEHSADVSLRVRKAGNTVELRW